VIAKRVSIVTALTGLNLVVTLVNQVILAYLFGAGASMDAFLACGAVPFVVLNLAIGDLGYVLVPLLMRCEKDGELDRAIESTFTAILVLSVGVSILGVVFHRSILHWTTASNMPANTFNLAASMAPVMWVIIGLTIVGSYLTGIHYFRRQFASPSITLAVPYLGMIAGGLIGARTFGIISVAVGWAVGTLLRDLILFVTLPGRPMRLSQHLRHPAASSLFRSLPVLGLSLLPFAALPMIDVYWASRLPVGSISYLGYSNRIVIALTAIVVQGISVVLFPDLSEQIAKGETQVFRSRVIEAMKIIFLLMVPLAVAVAMARAPIVELALKRGKFTLESAMGVSRVLPFYLLGAIFMAMMNIVIRSFYAMQNYRTPAKLGMIALVLYTSVSGLFIGRFSYLAVGMAYAVFWLFMFGLQAHFLGNRITRILDRGFITFMGKVLTSSIAAAALVISVSISIGLHNKSGGIALTEGAAGLLVFVAISHFIFKLEQYPKIFEIAQRKWSVVGRQKPTPVTT
jgi:putative peptidoglycan lipid II flippase